MVLLNLVLNSIPNLYASFLKMSDKVMKLVVTFAKKFLYGGAMGRRKMCWVKWTRVCQPRKKGGLGERDVRFGNLSLLAKWKWRLLSEQNMLWQRVIEDKHGMKYGRPVLIQYMILIKIIRVILTCVLRA